MKIITTRRFIALSLEATSFCRSTRLACRRITHVLHSEGRTRRQPPRRHPPQPNMRHHVRHHNPRQTALGMQGVHILRHVRQVPRPHPERGDGLLQMVTEDHVEIFWPPRIDKRGLDAQETGAALGSTDAQFVIPAIRDQVMGCIACSRTPISDSPHNTHTHTHTPALSRSST
jgi:hypothetical protein